jgi:redox-sensitive bicupin YhaK (pirin superfamily)
VSNLETAPAETPCGVDVATGPVAHLLPGREVPLGRYATVRRMLPDKTRYTVGAWCFVDHFGPDDIAGGPGMLVPPHPHIGLQTVSWLVDGEVEHRDSIGGHQVVRPGGVNIMTAGRGIAHAETSPSEHGGTLHGLQLWIALPHTAMDTGPDFVHVPTLPYVCTNTMLATVVIGEFAGMCSPAPTFTPIVGVDLAINGPATVPLRPDFEYAVISTTGTASVAGVELNPGSLLYLGAGRDSLPTHADRARLFLLGGEPFADSLVMWWNFVGRDHDEIVAAREEWEAARQGVSGTRFAMVAGSPHDPLPAPPMPTTRLKPRSDRDRL